MNECLHENFLLNGEILCRKKFNANLLIRGKCFYEVIRIIDGYYIFTEDHIQRLENSLKIFNIDYCIENKTLINYLLKYKLNNNLYSGNIRLVINFNDITECRPDILIYLITHSYPSAVQYKNGIDTSILNIERQMPNAKFVNHNVLSAVRKELGNSSVYETLLCDNKGFITEGSKSNVFFIKDDTIYTPPENRVLPGITRKHIFTICNMLNINILEKEISIDSLKDYDTVFISGTSAKVLPVKKINDISYNVNSMILERITDLYETGIRDYILKRKQSDI